MGDGQLNVGVYACVSVSAHLCMCDLESMNNA